MVNLTSNSFNGLFQVFFYLGLLLMGYGLLQAIEATKIYKQQDLSYDIAVDSLDVDFNVDSIKAVYEDRDFDRLSAGILELDTIRSGKNLEQREKYTNQMKVMSDSMRIIRQHAEDNIWKSMRQKGFIEAMRKRTENSEDDYSRTKSTSITFVILGFIIFMGSGVVLQRNENRTKNITLIDQYKKGKVWLWCQSCGRNFSSKRPHGTESDKSKNFGYCLECYKEGQFTEPNLTREEVKAIFDTIIQSYKGTKYENKVKKHFEKRFNTLERWEQSEYREITLETYLNV